MRIKISMVSEGVQTIDINYNYHVSSFIYKCIDASDKGYSQFLHDQGYVEDNKGYKLFCFSMLIAENYKVDGSNFIIDGKVDLYVTSPMKKFLMAFVDIIAMNPDVKIGNGSFRITNIETMIEPDFRDEMRFRCLSPVAMATAVLGENEKLKKIDLYLEDKKYAENIRMNLISKYKILFGREPDNTEINIEFMNIEKFKRGKRIQYKDNVSIKGYLAPFKMKGSTELMKVAYECGLGDRNSLGLGMIETI